jgi:hypothetical protein
LEHTLDVRQVRTSFSAQTSRRDTKSVLPTIYLFSVHPATVSQLVLMRTPRTDSFFNLVVV